MARVTVEDYRELLGNNSNTAETELKAVDSVIHELDDAIQDSGNLQLSRRLNDIYDSFKSIRQIIKTSGR